MKKIMINFYYNFLIKLEDIFGSIEISINNHRKNIDDKYWDKYLSS